MVSFMPQLLYLWGRVPGTATLDALEREKCFAPAGNVTPIPEIMQLVA
jgi:hypothetical protein